MNEEVKFFKIKKRYSHLVPVFFNYLFEIKYQKQRKQAKGNFVPMEFYKTTMAMVDGHYKPISKCIRMEELKN